MRALRTSEEREFLRRLVTDLSANVSPDAYSLLRELHKANPSLFSQLVGRLREYVRATATSVLTADVIRRVMSKLPHRRTQRKKTPDLVSLLVASSPPEAPPPVVEPKSRQRQSTVVPKVEAVVKPTPPPVPVPPPEKRETRPAVRELAGFRVLRSVPQYTIVDSEESFRQMFLDRFNKLKAILEQQLGRRVGFLNTLRITQDGAYAIVMVYSKRQTQKGYVMTGDDPTGELTVFVPPKGELELKYSVVPLDAVIALKLRPGRGLPVVEDIIFPDVPATRKPRRAPRPCKILVISDIHVGSKQFLEARFRQLIKFLAGKSDDAKMRRLAREIEFVIIAGDLVDGVGVYPNQEEELAVADIYEQYRMLRDYLSEVPSDKTIIAIPGNHDASTKLLPQPPIPDAFSKPLKELGNVVLLSNPAWIEIEGVRILMYHGYGVEQIAAQLGLDLKRPTRVMIELMRCRHLCPTWGYIPMAPMPKDYLVIDEIPDVFIMGHVHVADARLMKGNVLLLVPGTFQGLTSWQRQLGIEPTPGIGIVCDLHTMRYNFICFTETGAQLLSA